MNAFLISLLLIIPSAVFCQPLAGVTNPADVEVDPQRLTRIDESINAYIQQQKMPGAVAMIVRSGKVAYLKAFGGADVDTRNPSKPMAYSAFSRDGVLSE